MHVEDAMTKKRQRRSAAFTFEVALASVKEQQTLPELASTYEVHPTQIAQWKRQLLDGGSRLFGQQHIREQHEQMARATELFEHINNGAARWSGGAGLDRIADRSRRYTVLLHKDAQAD